MKNLKSNLPKQYSQGWTEFYKLKFKVTPDVLIPRPETELLVDYVIKFIKTADSPIHRYTDIPTILDLGTGSGCIAISLAKNLPKAKIFASDVSESALEVAQENAKLNNVEEKIFFIQSDLLEDIKSRPDILVTNLPYIPSYRLPFLDPSVIDFEPRMALDGGPNDGFNLYRKLFQQIKSFGVNSSRPRGDIASHRIKKCLFRLLVGEIDYTQGDLALSEAQKYFPEAQVEVKQDLAKKQRILVIKW